MFRLAKGFGHLRHGKDTLRTPHWRLVPRAGLTPESEQWGLGAISIQLEEPVVLYEFISPGRNQEAVSPHLSS